MRIFSISDKNPEWPRLWFPTLQQFWEVFSYFTLKSELKVTWSTDFSPELRVSLGKDVISYLFEFDDLDILPQNYTWKQYWTWSPLKKKKLAGNRLKVNCQRNKPNESETWRNLYVWEVTSSFFWEERKV